MTIIYKYDFLDGGLADLIKFLACIVKLAEDTNHRLLISIEHPIKKYVIIKHKYVCDIDYTKFDTLEKFELENNTIVDILKTNKNLVISPKNLYNNNINFLKYIDSYQENVKKYSFFDYADFTSDIYKKLSIIIKQSKYICIHLRYGDKYLEIKRKCLVDDRNVNLNKINDIMNDIVKKNKQVYFFCDNNIFKKQIALKYPQIKYFDIPCINISYNYFKVYPKEKYYECLENVIIEFLIIKNSIEIHSLTYSGFPLVAHLLNKESKFYKYY